MPTEETTSVEQTNSGRIKASPLARKLAREMNIDLDAVHGTGPEGRIIKRDLKKDLGGIQGRSPINTTSIAISTPAKTGMRYGGVRTAKAVELGTAATAMLFATASITMLETVKLHSILQAKPDYKGISINHMLIKAAAYGLDNEPSVNKAQAIHGTPEASEVDISLATLTEAGYDVLVLRAVDTLTLKELVLKEIALRRSLKTHGRESREATPTSFSISNLERSDIEHFTTGIEAGHSAALALSPIKEVPVVQAGELAVGLTLKATISYDPRLVGEAAAANFLRYFREALETPALLIV
ncbi:2-oxo acid dehydrogenase subunit E2 [Oligoflexia bacterium]|nr:2-oxo acid dehydrogenase subunit E2 [Oligoflexia bacterium]